MPELPVLFLSHGNPDLPLSPHPAKTALQEIGRELPRPVGYELSRHIDSPRKR